MVRYARAFIYSSTFIFFPIPNLISFHQGGEKNTIEFFEGQSVITSSTPLLEDAYSYGVVEHPFPVNCCLREWKLGPEFYNAVKIGIVQYVCSSLFEG